MSEKELLYYTFSSFQALILRSTLQVAFLSDCSNNSLLQIMHASPCALLWNCSILADSYLGWRGSIVGCQIHVDTIDDHCYILRPPAVWACFVTTTMQEVTNHRPSEVTPR